MDFSRYTSDRLPWFIGAVLVLSFLLLMVVFRSLLVPLKAVIMNLLSVGAAYGILVAVFQWGWGDNLLGVGREGPIEAWIPMMLFAVIFGLSMDYEVFLLSRIREEYDRTHDNAEAVANGLAATARVITAAAAIMFFVFFSFVLGDDRSLKMFGFGLAMAVLIDATIVRLVLVPATMELLGDRNWWLPAVARSHLAASCTSKPTRRSSPVPRPSCVDRNEWGDPMALARGAGRAGRRRAPCGSVEPRQRLVGVDDATRLRRDVARQRPERVAGAKRAALPMVHLTAFNALM